ncbi:hypothetical protein BO94DRAFT_537579 [Aspergillus sclerotioniger CBS 115572]|uniref:Uncharacterized protein n=1 Tax=Aspergillus sclerotioniger CBS 115572 TaxID=1450535 RepID=A0A317VZN0_9EURO|nr:hypothetical protein BO94DRAFT_537579 [Aspergillus sclerotioniger CBS 115572]PWY78398.1 hypothetical protein BO94DRAFT_537579 [Aspergillus sclerotioniger CBS 115572]
MSFQAGGRGCFNCGDASHQVNFSLSSFSPSWDPNLLSDVYLKSWFGNVLISTGP